MHPARWWHDAGASYPYCGARVAGCVGAISRGGFGRRRIPMRLEAAGGEL